ncbi:hypothetical protein [Phenylobacterium immobile]|uniref:hypothetical protein n=1 Tax=Phenylobacterium immobile TaxID=21 RepID=UPI000B1E3E66|nr:hypothetical protein [Phenylobacterium immobile]
MNPTKALLALTALLFPLSAAEAQVGTPARTALFISPCGEPFRVEAPQAYPVGAWFAKIDSNNDHALDKAELRADAAAFFKVLDLDHDGVVAGVEITNYEMNIVPEILGMYRAEAPASIIRVQLDDNTPVTRDPMGGRIQDRGPVRDPGLGMEGASAFTFLQEPQPVSASDGNFDRRITAAEFAGAADRRFRLLDRDQDGKLTLAELPRTAAQKQFEDGDKGRKKRRS